VTEKASGCVTGGLSATDSLGVVGCLSVAPLKFTNRSIVPSAKPGPARCRSEAGPRCATAREPLWASCSAVDPGVSAAGPEDDEPPQTLRLSDFRPKREVPVNSVRAVGGGLRVEFEDPTFSASLKLQKHLISIGAIVAADCL
jgi:hypothetical protein